MNFLPYDNLSKIWEPTNAELNAFSKNKYVANMNQGAGSDHNNIVTNSHTQSQLVNLATSQPAEEISIHTFLYTMIKRTNQNSTMLEEEAVMLCSMLRKEGFFDSTGESECTVCATEKLEKDIIETMQRQIEFTKLARNFYAQPENAENYNLCDKHRPFDPNDYVPKPNEHRYSLPRPILPAKIDIPNCSSTDIHLNKYLEQTSHQQAIHNYNSINFTNPITSKYYNHIPAQTQIRVNEVPYQNFGNVVNHSYSRAPFLYQNIVPNNIINQPQSNYQMSNICSNLPATPLNPYNVHLPSNSASNYFTSLTDDQLRETQESAYVAFNSTIQNIIEEIQNRGQNGTHGRFRKVRKILGKKHE